MDEPNIRFGSKEELIGYVETDSGGIIITDGVWGDAFPSVSQDRINVNLDLGKCRIPVFGFSKNGKRYLLLALDEAEDLPPIEGVVPVTDLPEKEEPDADSASRNHGEAE